MTYHVCIQVHLGSTNISQPLRSINLQLNIWACKYIGLVAWWVTTVPLQYNTILCGLVHTSGNGFIKTLNKIFAGPYYN